MITYLGLAYILPYGFDLDRLGGLGGWVGGMLTYLGLAHIRPYGFDLDRLDGLGGGGGGMVRYLGLAYILPIQVGWVGWVGWVGGDDNIPWTCIHTTIRIRFG